MSKQKTPHKYIYKLHSNRLAQANWDLTLPLTEAIDNRTDIIELSDSQLLRFIDEIRGKDTAAKVAEIKAEIKKLKAGKRTSAVNRKIKSLYMELYETQFQKDYVNIVMDNMHEYDRCNKGFTINGIKYKRFLGTNGGIKNSTIIYLSEDIYPEIKKRLDCGRSKSMQLIPAKLEAYQALICSGSIPVSMPKGIIVIQDCMTHFTSDAIYIDDSTTEEPIVTERHDHEIDLDASDGFGFMCPEISMRWSGELNDEPDRYLSAVNTRGIPWTKGMLFTFDFVAFAEKVAENYWIQDAWGDWRDVREAEVILTTSMLKLWDSYSSWEEYQENFEKYNYQFAVSKTAPYELEEERQTNYQFIQSYELEDEDIVKLVSPTVDHIKEIIGLDYRKAILYLKGTHIDPQSVLWKSAGVADALMIEPSLINDPYVRSLIYDSIKTRIRRAKTGVLDVQGNFAIIGGDIYSLAQSMFGIKVTGLLKSGQIYHKFWLDRGVDEVCCFRAPMTSHNNIRKQQVANPANSDNFADMEYWYQYVTTCVLFNSWDTTAEALNGCDFDGDLCFTTNDPVLLANTRKLPAIYCVQRKGSKKLVEEADIIQSNKMSFGDAIGATTNVITSQICALAKFEKGSKEYNDLQYRILCGQLYQQGCIDKAKGVINKPMPKYWYSLSSLKPKEDDTEEEAKRKEYLRTIAVDRKPYFFIYNYDHLYSRYNAFIKKQENSCVREFGISLAELKQKKTKTEDEKTFLRYCEMLNPVDNSPCVVNKLCWYIEDNIVFSEMKSGDKEFDPSILKSPSPKYTHYQYYAVKNLLEEEYKAYRIGMKDLVQDMNKQGIHGTDQAQVMAHYTQSFIMKSKVICPDEDLRCDLFIDIGYKSNASKKFIWEICGRQIIRNLLERHDDKLWYPIRSSEAEFEFHGEKFRMTDTIIQRKKITEDE